MKLFVDSASLADIRESLARGFPSGITTNPSILAKEEKQDYRKLIRGIIELVGEFGRTLPLSVEVFTTDPDGMVNQAEEFVSEFGDYEGLTIKVPVGWNELRVVNTLSEKGILVNCTCAMSYNQAVMALNAGARYVSLFWGRIRDVGYDAASIVSQVRSLMDINRSDAEIIVGSIRQMVDVNEAMQAGAHIVTVPPPFFVKMCEHPKTTEAVNQFVSDFRAWMS